MFYILRSLPSSHTFWLMALPLKFCATPVLCNPKKVLLTYYLDNLICLHGISYSVANWDSRLTPVIQSLRPVPTIRLWVRGLSPLDVKINFVPGLDIIDRKIFSIGWQRNHQGVYLVQAEAGLVQRHAFVIYFLSSHLPWVLFLAIFLATRHAFYCATLYHRGNSYIYISSSLEYKNDNISLRNSLSQALAHVYILVLHSIRPAPLCRSVLASYTALKQQSPNTFEICR